MTGNDSHWRKSSFSGGEGGNCIEVGIDADGLAVRDSQDRDRLMLNFTASSWQAFTSKLKAR